MAFQRIIVKFAIDMNGEKLTLDPASVSDTGQWRLIVDISDRGMSAVLKNTESDYVPPVLVMKAEWSPDSANLLEWIESAVYDHPRLLDDFATHIIITTPSALWIPAELTDDEEFDEKLFTVVYPSKTEDINADFGGDEVCLYTLTPGLNSFLQRTMPGCKITSHLSVLKKEFEKLVKGETFAEDTGLFINIRDGYADIFAFSNGDFICGASHPWLAMEDIAYKTLLMCRAYDLPFRETNTVIVPGKLNPDELKSFFSRFFKEVSVTSMPALSSQHGVPVAEAIAAGQGIQISES